MFDTQRTFEDGLQGRCRFRVGLRHELFFAMQVATDPGARIHPDWQDAIRRVLARTPTFQRASDGLYGAHALWTLLPDAFEPAFVGERFDDVVAALRALDAATLQERLLVGVLHDEPAVRSILAGERDVAAAVREARPAKRELLAFMGLYPPDPGAPLLRALELLRSEPEAFRGHVIAAVTAFWGAGFEETWTAALPGLERARADKERLFAACSLEEFVQRALIRVEVDRGARVLRAVRGGYALPLGRLEAAYFTPSMFNDRRHWAAYDHDHRVVAHFPMIEPTLAPAFGEALPAPPIAPADPELDPALVFRALGDATRFAVASLLAAEPRTAADLCKVLGVSRPTMSHHVQLLREAGLLGQVTTGTRVVLSLRRDVIERLSRATVDRLFTPGTSAQEPLTTTRRRTCASR